MKIMVFNDSSEILDILQRRIQSVYIIHSITYQFENVINVQRIKFILLLASIQIIHVIKLHN